jgi:2-methylcitrate dehydratase
MYIVAVALQDGFWHHVKSYAPERAQRADTVRLWQKIHTIEDKRWTERYHSTDPAVKAFGGRIIIRMKDGSEIAGEMAVANAHTLGATPWVRKNYIAKFDMLTAGILDPGEAKRFLDTVQALPSLKAQDLDGLTVALPERQLAVSEHSGIFSWAR